MTWALRLNLNPGIAFLCCTLNNAPAPDHATAARLLSVSLTRDPEAIVIDVPDTCGLIMPSDPDRISAWKWPGAVKARCDDCIGRNIRYARVSTWLGRHRDRATLLSEECPQAVLCMLREAHQREVPLQLGHYRSTGTWPAAGGYVLERSLVAGNGKGNATWSYDRCSS